MENNVERISLLWCGTRECYRLVPASYAGVLVWPSGPTRPVAVSFPPDWLSTSVPLGL